MSSLLPASAKVGFWAHAKRLERARSAEGEKVAHAQNPPYPSPFHLVNMSRFANFTEHEEKRNKREGYRKTRNESMQRIVSFK